MYGMVIQRTGARERILATASKPFYHQGLRVVGVGAPIAASAVAEMALYQHFGSKGRRITAHLERRNTRWRGWFIGTVSHTAAPRGSVPRSPMARIPSTKRGFTINNGGGVVPCATSPPLSRRSPTPRQPSYFAVEGATVTTRPGRRTEPARQARAAAADLPIQP